MTLHTCFTPGYVISIDQDDPELGCRMWCLDIHIWFGGSHHAGSSSLVLGFMGVDRIISAVPYIHTSVWILIHWGQDLRILWICCYTNFWVCFSVSVKTRKTVLLEYG